MVENLKEIRSLIEAGAPIAAVNKIDEKIKGYEAEIKAYDDWCDQQAEIEESKGQYEFVDF